MFFCTGLSIIILSFSVFLRGPSNGPFQKKNSHPICSQHHYVILLVTAVFLPEPCYPAHLPDGIAKKKFWKASMAIN